MILSTYLYLFFVFPDHLSFILMFLSDELKCKKSIIFIFYKYLFSTIYLLLYINIKKILINLFVLTDLLSFLKNKKQQIRVCCIFITTNLILFTYFIEFNNHKVTEEACLAANSRNSSYIFLFEEFDVSSDIDLIIANGTFNS